MNAKLTLLLMLCPALALGGCERKQAANGESGTAAAPLPVVELRITRADGRTVTLSAEVALDQAAQERGLAGRAALAPGAAMIFAFERLKPASFWMKGTAFPIDHLFVKADGRIAAILPGKPNDLTPISTGEAVRAVVQIGGGQAVALGLKEGDRLRWGQCQGKSPRPPEAWDRLAFCQ